MRQPPEGGAGVCDRCLGLGTSIQTSTDKLTHVGRSERSCPVTQVDASSDEEGLVSSNHGRRVVPRVPNQWYRTHEFSSSGFLNMCRDLERASVSVRADTERDVMDDDRDVESLVSGRSGASDVSEMVFLKKRTRRSRKIPHPQSSWAHRPFEED